MSKIPDNPTNPIYKTKTSPQGISSNPPRKIPGNGPVALSAEDEEPKKQAHSLFRSAQVGADPNTGLLPGVKPPIKPLAGRKIRIRLS